jgi:hypothetical protein
MEARIKKTTVSLRIYFARRTTVEARPDEPIPDTGANSITFAQGQVLRVVDEQKMKGHTNGRA